MGNRLTFLIILPLGVNHHHITLVSIDLLTGHVGICLAILLFNEGLQNAKQNVKERLLILAIKLAVHSHRLEEYLGDYGHGSRMLQKLFPVISQLD